jgi:hypothetical protein
MIDQYKDKLIEGETKNFELISSYEMLKKELEQEDRRLKLEEDRSKRIDKLMEKYLDDKIDTETFERLLKLI